MLLANISCHGFFFMPIDYHCTRMLKYQNTCILATVYEERNLGLWAWQGYFDWPFFFVYFPSFFGWCRCVGVYFLFIGFHLTNKYEDIVSQLRLLLVSLSSSFNYINYLDFDAGPFLQFSLDSYKFCLFLQK